MDLSWCVCLLQKARLQTFPGAPKPETEPFRAEDAKEQHLCPLRPRILSG